MNKSLRKMGLIPCRGSEYATEERFWELTPGCTPLKESLFQFPKKTLEKFQISTLKSSDYASVNSHDLLNVVSFLIILLKYLKKTFELFSKFFTKISINPQKSIKMRLSTPTIWPQNSFQLIHRSSTCKFSFSFFLPSSIIQSFVIFTFMTLQKGGGSRKYNSFFCMIEITIREWQFLSWIITILNVIISLASNKQ